jgi:hypothetical protein
MNRRTRFVAAAVVASIVLLALSAWLHSWGGLALIVLGAAGGAWYRAQVAQADESGQFFGDLGEETRLNALQATAPGELPMERPLPAAAATPRRRL